MQKKLKYIKKNNQTTNTNTQSNNNSNNKAHKPTELVIVIS